MASEKFIPKPNEFFFSNNTVSVIRFDVDQNRLTQTVSCKTDNNRYCVEVRESDITENQAFIQGGGV